MPQPRMILVRPQMGENIGASARAMWNFGLERMCLTSPRDGWPNPSAIAMASGAAQVLDHVKVVDSTKESVADLHYIMATTARDRDLTKEVLSPKEAMSRAKAMIDDGKQVGIMFGPERSGLENEDLVHANALVSVPVNPAFGSLNLAQCVLLMSYEWQLAQAEVKSSQMAWASASPASAQERNILLDKLEERLEEIGFFWPEEKAQGMRNSLRNLFSRLPLSDIDVRMLHGVFRALWRGEKFKNKR